ncbi:MAG: hypothetical protein JSS66_00875 [Armatimonadetes bacterium]|nr:hypothetical protein [Armatimonadota bacterium]
MKWDRSKGRPEPIRALNRIREIENGEALLNIREVAPELRILRPGALPWARKTVIDMARNAASRLPTGVFIGIVEALRPWIRQKMIYDMMWRHLAEARPGLSHAVMRRIVCRWVAPVDQKAPPGHCTGAALDVYLVDKDNEFLDVTSPFSRFDASPTYVYGLTEAAQANRNMLVECMTAAGFSNCRDEFWHYSYGDAGWAVRTGRTECIYGLATLDPAVWAESQKVWEKALEERPNPFLVSGP